MNKKAILLSVTIGMLGCHKPAILMSDADYLARIHQTAGFPGVTGGRDAIISAAYGGDTLGGNTDRAYSVTKAEFNAEVRKLQASGHIDNTATGMWETVLGQYGWYSTGIGNGAFGMYVLYPPAVEQAKRSWYIHAKVAPHSDIIVAQGANVRFDPSIVGHSVRGIYQTKSDKYLTGKVIAVINDKSVRIDHRADGGGGEQWSVPILPSDYVDMCQCHQ